jgi:anthranilate/para-aminobenzoate synthase component II
MNVINNKKTKVVSWLFAPDSSVTPQGKNLMKLSLAELTLGSS